MLNIKKMFHGKHIDFSFFDDKLLIAVHTQKYLFETTSLLTSTLRYTKVREVVNPDATKKPYLKKKKSSFFILL